MEVEKMFLIDKLAQLAKSNKELVEKKQLARQGAQR
jgi:hypothetical protein